MKIAIFSGSIPSTSFIERLIVGVSRHHDVYVFGMQKQDVDYTSKSVKVYGTPNTKYLNLFVTSIRAIQLFFKNPKHLFLLVKAVKSKPSNYARFMHFSRCLPIVLHLPDIVHLQWAKDLPNYAFLKTTFNIALVVSFRGAHINYTPIIEPDYKHKYQNTFPLVDAFHGVSEAIITEACKYGAIKDRSRVIYSPIPKLFFTEFQNFQKPKTKTIKIVSVGRNHWKKGYAYAIAAISILKEKGYDVQYTLIGLSKPNEALLFQVNQLQLQDSVLLKGQYNQKQLLQALKTEHVLLLPSLEEGIANVVLEAMSLGLPVISTDCGGMAEVIKPKTTGWLVPSRSANAIADAIIDFDKTSEIEIDTITQNAFALVKRAFDYDSNIKKFIKLYESVV